MFRHNKISNQYISMCESALDIQLAWQPKKDDIIKVKDLKKLQILNQVDNRVVYFESGLNAKIDDCTWIPTQYQLEKLDNSWRITWQFYDYIHNGLNKYLKFFKSEEELWLAFLMYKLSNKIWNGKIWILRKI